MEQVIKWSGSKRLLADEIIREFPTTIDTYYEPFCGSASVALRMMEIGYRCEKYVLSDINEDLISLWIDIKEDYKKLYCGYKLLWEKMKSLESVDEKRKFFSDIRDDFNNSRNTIKFLFLTRTCINGMPRYNKYNNFNTSYHLNRDGINPDSLLHILSQANMLLNRNNAVFKNCDYSSINPIEKDFAYFDPPYLNTKGMYFGEIDSSIFFNYIKTLECPYCFTYNGMITCNKSAQDEAVSIDNSLYDKHIYLNGKNSSFRRMFSGISDSSVQESLYIKGVIKNKENKEKLF